MTKTNKTVGSSLCPICKNTVSEDFFPFCSRTCAYVDLGNWFNEKYSVPVELNLDDEESLTKNNDNEE